jgi:hypothetical protein
VLNNRSDLDCITVERLRSVSASPSTNANETRVVFQIHLFSRQFFHSVQSGANMPIFVLVDSQNHISRVYFFKIMHYMFCIKQERILTILVRTAGPRPGLARAYSPEISDHISRVYILPPKRRT